MVWLRGTIAILIVSMEFADVHRQRKPQLVSPWQSNIQKKRTTTTARTEIENSIWTSSRSLDTFFEMPYIRPKWDEYSDKTPSIKSATTRTKRELELGSLITKYSEVFAQFNTSFEMVIGVQNSSCPLVALCTGNTNARWDSTKSCCGRCSCMKDCRILNKCCPDAGIDIDLDEPLFELQCVQAKYFTNQHYLEHSYRMVTRCSIHNNTDWVRKCDLQSNEMPLLALKIPVSSNSENGLVFQNKYCAWCNGYLDIITWGVEIGCTKENEHIRNSLANSINLDLLDEQIENSKGICDVYYMVPEHETPTICEDIGDLNIHHCNATGLWDTYHPWIEYACGSYYSPYLSLEHIYYRNVFCYICNIKEIDATMTVISDLSVFNNDLQYCIADVITGPGFVRNNFVFSEILNFDYIDSYPIPEKPTSNCSAGTSMFDKYKVLYL